jgi:serine/threonine-protein kinase
MQPAGTPRQLKLPSVGELLGGKYKLVRLIGEGGMASVFEASHQRLEQRVAIKILAPEFCRDAELVARFEREARAVSGLRSRHAVRVLDVDATPEGLPYIVMDLLLGRDLDDELKARGRLPVDEAVGYVLQVCAAMIEAHQLGIIHRDLKPANLFLAQEAGGTVLKVLDFGVSKVMGASRLTATGAVMGTVMYMSPEQVIAQPTVDGRADIWALGVILFELLAGKPPWVGNSREVAKAILTRDAPDLSRVAAAPEGVVESVRTMLQREPERRFASMTDVLLALAPYAAPGSVGAAAAELFLSKPSARGLASRPLDSLTYTLPMATRPQQGAVTPPQHGFELLTPLGTLGPPPTSLAPPSGPAARPTQARGVLWIAIGLGLLGLAGIVLIIAATARRSHRHDTDLGDAAPARAP